VSFSFAEGKPPSCDLESGGGRIFIATGSSGGRRAVRPARLLPGESLH